MKSKTIKVISKLLPIIGIIFGIILGMACKVDVSDDWWSEDLVFNIGLMLETWLFFDLLAIFFGWLSSVLCKLENIEKTICGTSVNDSINNNYYQNINAPAQMTPQTHFKSVGTSQNVNCPNCGESNLPTNSFCFKCGALLTQSPMKHKDTEKNK